VLKECDAQDGEDGHHEQHQEERVAHRRQRLLGVAGENARKDNDQSKTRPPSTKVAEVAHRRQRLLGKQAKTPERQQKNARKTKTDFSVPPPVATPGNGGRKREIQLRHAIWY
jgi:hypothetical protein